MPLVPTAMSGLLMAGFIPTMTDDTFASTVANAVNNYCTTGLINAPVIAGTVSAGVFTGTVSAGTMTTSLKDSDIKSITDEMVNAWKDVADWYADHPDAEQSELDQQIEKAKEKGDDYLAEELSKLIDDACKNAQFNCIIIGTAVQGTSSTPLTDTGTVTWNGVKDTLISGLKSACKLQQDALIATSIATALTSYLTSAVIKIEGTASCKGAQGVGIMS